MIVRVEPWGAWVRLETEAAVLALDRDGARALGVDGGAMWQGGEPPMRPPIEVHLAVTARCGAGCRGCYLDARPDGLEPSFAELVLRLDALRAAGVLTVAFGGGEPTTRSDLDALAQAARARDLVPVMTTSGLGLTPRRAAALRGFAQVNVSYDGEGVTYADVRGFDGARSAEAAIALLAGAGVRVGVNVVLTRGTFSKLGATVRRARALGACEAQLLRYKPAGRAASLDYLARRLAPEQAASLGATLRELAASLAADGLSMPLRIDCALVPFLSADAALTAEPERLARFGVLGCEAANALSSVDVHGRVAPCSFLTAGDSSVDALARGASDAVRTRLRDRAASPPEPCASCTIRATCRGGCRAVAAFFGDPDAPDPECPRVRAARAGGA